MRLPHAKNHKLLRCKPQTVAARNHTHELGRVALRAASACENKCHVRTCVKKCHDRGAARMGYSHRHMGVFYTVVCSKQSGSLCFYMGKTHIVSMGKDLFHGFLMANYA